MKYIKVLLFCPAILFGCSFNQLQNDYANNQHFEKVTHADSAAPYIGDWAVPKTKWLKVLKIRDNGIIRVVLAPEFGAIEGKVYLDKERPFLILKDGTKAKIVSVNKDHLQIEAYGRLEKFAPMLETKRFN